MLYLRNLCAFFSLLSVSFFSSMLFAANYVGSTTCADCHQEQYKDWRGSHHERAMDHANPKSVKGDFNNASASFNDEKSHFFTKDDLYWANISGADGKFKDYQIKYTFGFEPLQQYMVELDNGRIQLIPFAWDTRPKANGGQRWFYLHPEHSKPHNEFHWTNTGQNWNYMCADCHSTNVKKNFDVKTNSYNTTFSEINVGCESCHGPASEHIQWSNKKIAKKGTESRKDTLGFDRVLSKPVQQWLFNSKATTASPKTINHSDQSLVCAQCHSRHVQISDNDYVSSGQFGNRYMLNLIDRDHYYPDGQVQDEDYVYGSFLQSKMNANGVTCTNCHNPHSAKLTIPKEAVCLQCHQASTFAQKSHHGHPDNSTGAQCVNCHMPETTYMQVDTRRDHKWHVPRPDYAAKFGTPDTCLSCHKDKDSQWSNQITESWNPGKKVIDELQFAPVFAAADQGFQGAASALSHIAQNDNHTAIIRASALERLGPYADTNSLIAAARGVKNPSEYVRLGAIRGATNLPQAERWRIVSPLLKDPVLAVRTEAVAALMPLWRELQFKQQQQLKPALEEYLKVEAFNADRGFSHTNTGNMYMHQGMLIEARAAYMQSIRIEPGFDAAYLYLADTYRQQGNEQESTAHLLAGKKANPDNGAFSYRLGLGQIRAKRYSKAIEHFQSAITIDPKNAQYHYILALTLERSQPSQAASSLRNAFDISQNPQHLYALCEITLKHKLPDAAGCLTELTPLVPPQVVQALKKQYQ